LALEFLPVLEWLLEMVKEWELPGVWVLG